MQEKPCMVHWALLCEVAGVMGHAGEALHGALAHCYVLSLEQQAHTTFTHKQNLRDPGAKHEEAVCNWMRSMSVLRPADVPSESRAIATKHRMSHAVMQCALNTACPVCFRIWPQAAAA